MRRFFVMFLTAVLGVWWLSAQAETTAQKVFGRWESKRIEQIMDSVPEWEPSRTLPGAVSKSDLGKPVPDACPVTENGHVIGFRFNCSATDRRASHGGPLVPSASDF